MHWVSVMGVNVLFSYQTAIAFNDDRQRLRVRNTWGPTTGRHMNEANVRDYTEVSDKAFNEALDAALVRSALESVKNKFIPASHSTPAG